jgi:hypothetical protein
MARSDQLRSNRKSVRLRIVVDAAQVRVLNTTSPVAAANPA